MAIGALISGLVGGLGDEMMREQDRKYAEAQQQKQFAIQMLGQFAQDPSLRPEGQQYVLGELSKVLGLKPKDSSMIPVLLGQVAQGLNEQGPPQMNVGYDLPAKPGAQQFELPMITGPGGPQVQIGEPLLKHRYRPGEREADVARAQLPALVERLKAEIGAKKEAEQAEQQRLFDMLPKIGLPQEMVPYAQYEILTGRNAPTMAAERLNPLQTGVETVISPTGEARRVTHEDAIRLTAQGWKPAETARPTAGEINWERTIQSYMVQGMDREQATLQALRDMGTGRQLDFAKTRATVSFLNRQVNEPSSGERTEVGRIQTQVAGIMREARAVGQKLLNPLSEEAIGFQMRTNREATAADAAAAEQAYAQQAIETLLGVPMEEAVAMIQAHRRRYGGIQAPPIEEDPDNPDLKVRKPGPGHNPTWRPQ